MQVLLNVTDDFKVTIFFSFFSSSLNAFFALLEQRARVVERGLADAFRTRSAFIFRAEGGMAECGKVGVVIYCDVGIDGAVACVLGDLVCKFGVHT